MAHIVHFLKLPSRIPLRIHLVLARVDEFSFRAAAFWQSSPPEQTGENAALQSATKRSEASFQIALELLHSADDDNSQT
jgi:hypothetical protein